MLIRMENIVKTYGSLFANDRVDLNLEKGEILAVVGENGAGKSTLMKILYGLEQADEGRILINGRPARFRSPHDAIANGIGMVQQHFMLFPPFTAAENIVYTHETRRGPFFDRRAAEKKVAELSKRYGLEIDPSVRVADCPVGIQQRIEILKVLHQGVDIIIFDEPSAVLTPQEIDELLQTIRDLKAAGKSIILITHKLNEVMAVADRVLVMRNGKVVKEMPKSETSIEEMSYLMVGRQIEARPIGEAPKGGTTLEIEDLVLRGKGKRNAINHLSLSVRAGEIVGIAGVSGNGQSELIQCVTGLARFQKGRILINGKDTSGLPPSKIRASGCACIPEDRYFWGSAAEATLNENCIMAHYHNPKYLRMGIFKTRNVKKFAGEMMRSYDVRHGSQEQEMRELSGGNAQKLIVAREMFQNSPLLIAAEPTRGIDIGAADYIHGKLLDKRGNGGSVLLISSELSEIMELSDRIYVMFEGGIAGEFTRGDASREKIGLLMTGGKANE